MKLKSLFFLALLLICSTVFAIDPWGEPTILTGSMTVMAQVTLNGVPAASGDVLGAFVTVSGTPQLRGKATVQVISGIAGCLLQIYTETNGDTITFKVWDDSAQTAYDASQTLPSEVDGIIGSYPDNLYQITAGQNMVTDPWSEPAILTGSMTIMAQVSISGAPATDDDILAAFVTVDGQEQLRGKENISVVSGIAGCLLQVYTETNAEMITFKVWDYSAQQIQTATPTLPSGVNGIVGSWPENLFQIYAGGGTQSVQNPVFTPPAGTYQTTQNVGITCATTGAQIRYTTNGTDPNEASLLYGNPISLPLNTTTTIRARAYLSGWNPSQIITAVYIITGTVASPVMNPAGGTYPAAQNVAITCATAGAQIRYTTNGTEPTATSTLYSNPIPLPLNSTTTIKAKGYKTDWTPSATASATYIITGTVADPIMNPAGGNYNTPQSVTITCATAGAQIRYTTNGTEPTANSMLYSTPLAISTTTTLNAKAFKTDWIPSATNTQIYTIILGTVGTPTFNPAAGTYQIAQNIAISCITPGAQIRYTTDGTEPTATSSLYSNPIPLPLNSSTIIKAKGFKADWTPSAIATANYVITGTVPAPTFDPPAGSYVGAIDVVLACSLPGSTIRYSLDGTDPTQQSPQYSDPIHLAQTTTLKAIAYKADWTPSAMATALYQISTANEDDLGTPAVTGIHSIYPNPVSNTATIKLGSAGNAQTYILNIYNVKGECVYQSTGIGKGYVDINFQGRDTHGSKLPSGIYLLSLNASGATAVRKFVIK